MNSETHPHNAFLRQAVSPNLFTCTLHPEFIPALVAANLMTPCLWEWAESSVKGVDRTDPIAGLRSIHRFLNKRFHHATGEEFAAVWGLQESRHIRDADERAASDYAMQLMARSLSSVGQQHPWTLPLIPLLRDGLFPLYVYGTADVLRAQGRRHGKRILGLTSCLDECVLAASLAIAAKVCRWEDMIFLGSPLHYTVFFNTPRGTVWFNARREMFTQEEWNAHCAGESKEGKARNVLEKVIIADRLICGEGLAVFPQMHLSGLKTSVEQAIETVERFAGAKLEWLHPVPESSHDHLFHGWEAIPSGLSGKAPGVQNAVLERARQGEAPVLEAALTMFRHPAFCDPEILLQAARKSYYALLRAAAALSIDDVRAMAEAVPGHESFYGPSGRMAMPDEVLAFGTASDAERELLQRILLEDLEARAQPPPE